MTRWFKIVLIIILFSLLISPVSAWASWANTSFAYRAHTNIPDGVRPYQIMLTISNSTGTNNATNLFCNGHCYNNFSDIRFYLNDATPLSYWIEDNTTGKVWINVTANGTVSMYYSNQSMTTSSNATTTFPFFDDFSGVDLTGWTINTGSATVTGGTANLSGTSYARSNITFGVNTAVRSRSNFTTGLIENGYNGFAGGTGRAICSVVDDVVTIYHDAANANKSCANEDATHFTTNTITLNIINTFNTYDVMRNSTAAIFRQNDVLKDTITSNVPTAAMSAVIGGQSAGGISIYDWVLVRNYTYPEPAWLPWTTETSFSGNATVGNWTLNEGVGSYANDTSGYYNNGTITNVTWNNTDAVSGTSLYFNGTSYINVSTNPSINLSNTQSFTGWIKPQSLTGTHIVFEKGWPGFWENDLFLSDNTLAYRTLQPDGTVHSVVSVANILNDTWIFVSGTYQNNSLQTLRINDVLVSSTSSFSGTTTSGTYPLLFGSRYLGEFQFVGLMDELKLYNYALNSSELTTEYQRFHPFLSYPINGSTIAATYPPQTTDINFTWHDSEYPGNELLVSTDTSFNVLDVDIFTSNDYYLATLDVNKKYYWKIRQYNGTTSTYGDTSTVHNFTISSTGGATGQGVQGIVYEIIGGLDTPIDQATVYIYNTTWSSTSITGTNGYYLFSDLANGTYNMYAIKNGYDTTAVFPVTVNGSITTNDILMKIYISPYVPNFVFEKFIVRDLFDRSYPGVTVNVYKGDALTASFTGTTDSTGAVVFQLIKDQRYRVTFTGGGISGTITIYVYAKEENYYVRILTGFPTGGDRFTDISTNLTAISINATHSNLTLIYNDTKGSTSAVNFYAINLSTNATCYNSSVSNVVTLTCTVVAAGSYQFGFNATSSIYGFFQEDKVINFDVGKPSTPAIDTTVDSTLLQWASIILIVLTAALFSIRTVKYGAVIVPLEALALWAFGWFEPILNNQAGSFLLLSCAVVIGIMIYLRGSEVKVNF